MGTLIMLVPFTTLNFSTVKAQEYGAYDDDSYSHIQQTTKNMNVEQVHLKASL